MLYTDEDARHVYHKAPVLLQVVCQVLETLLAAYGVQLELIDAEKRAGFWIAAVAVDSEIQADAIDAVVNQVNKTFARHDEYTTCTLENDEVGLLTVRVTDSSDFSNVN